MLQEVSHISEYAYILWLDHLSLVPHIRLFGAKPLPEPMRAYCQLELISVKFESNSSSSSNFISNKYTMHIS